jgi:hypothetical protein
MRLKDSLMKRIKINKKTGCWEIQGYLDKDGYGEVSGKRAHRAAYELFIGEIPPKINVCHKCDNPKCCNPDHLFLGTQKENIKDMMLKGRKDPRFGERNTQNKIKEHQVLEIFNSNDLQHQIAKKYGIDQSTVSYIKSGKLWGWLTKGGVKNEILGI